MTRRALYHCTATVGTFTRTEQNVSISNPGIFSRNFSSSCLFFDPPVKAEQISDLKLKRKKKKVFLQIVEDNLPDKKLFRFLFFSFEKINFRQIFWNFFPFYLFFILGQITFYFISKLFLLLLLLRQFRFKLWPRVSKKCRIEPLRKKISACLLITS